VQFVVRNKLGWFLRSPKAIHEKIDQLFSDAAYRKSIQENLKSISIPSDNRAISTYIVEEKRALS
jgi:UDP-N-acetylglucosamine:LPS N-acetylglucosamine transferase